MSTFDLIHLDRSSILLISTNFKKITSIPIQHPRINNRIRAAEVRVIDQDNANLGVLPLSEALERASAAELDLIEVAPNAKPPVVRIMDYGKYLYQKEKEARESAKKQKNVELKTVRIGFNASPHDMELRAKKANELLEEVNRVQIDFVLKGRAKYIDRNFINNRLTTFLNLITIPHKLASEPKKGPRGLTVIVEKEKSNRE